MVDDTHVEYDGVTTSLSGLARKLRGATYQLQGPLYFTHNGVILAELRRQKENQGKNQVLRP